MNISLRLRHIVSYADFRKSEATNYKQWVEDEYGTLGPNDTVLFLSRTRNQMIFVYRTKEIESSEVIASVRLRFTSHRTWNPRMLANYATDVGIRLIGIKRFEAAYKKLLVEEEKAAKRKHK